MTSVPGLIAPKPIPEPSWLGLREAQYQLYRGAVAHSLNSNVNVVVVDEADVSRLDVIRGRLQALHGAEQHQRQQSPTDDGGSDAGGRRGRQLKMGRKGRHSPSPASASSRFGLTPSTAGHGRGGAPAAVVPVPIVSHRWIGDSIAAGRQLPVGGYLIA